VASKVDPAAERIRPVETLGTEIARYLELKRRSMKPSSFAATRGHLGAHCKPLHSLRLDEIDRRTVATLLGGIAVECGPTARNRVRCSLSGLFAWAIREGVTDLNPVSGTGVADEGAARDRVLTEAELAAVRRALGDDPFSEIVRVLILTGQRRTEIGGLRWD